LREDQIELKGNMPEEILIEAKVQLENLRETLINPIS
jgi:hypothetical protein